MSHGADISIIGPGKVGTALGVLAGGSGLRVAVGARRRESASAAAAAIGREALACTLVEAAAASGLVLLTVCDPAIEAVCRELAGSFRAGATIAHCSGVLDSGVLASARASGCQTGSMHPLQTFPSAEAAVAGFRGTYCFVEGSPGAVSALRDLALRIGARPEAIRPGAKALYHAAAAMACNHMVGLLDAAAAMACQAGIDRQTALSAIEPMIRATVENVFSMGPAAALTGPIARGDTQALGLHLRAVDTCRQELADFYRAAASWTIDLARRKGGIDEAQAAALREALRSHDVT